MMVRIVSIGSKRSVTLTSCGIGMVAPLSSSILRISKWFLKNYDCLFLWIRSLTRWPLVTDQGGQDPQDDEDDCLFCGRQLVTDEWPGRSRWSRWPVGGEDEGSDVRREVGCGVVHALPGVRLQQHFSSSKSYYPVFCLDLFEKIGPLGDGLLVE